jgi:predicted RNase H-like HicB family nuclease
VREFSVLLKTDPELPEQWVAHCLNWDLVTQGDSIEHAMKMVVEAVLMVIDDDRDAGLDPEDRRPAPDNLWDEFREIQLKGDRLSSPEALKKVSLKRKT